MSWGSKEPKNAGWYLVTLKNGTVMPALRKEYPEGNFTWSQLACGAEVIASLRFPKPSKEERK